MNLGWFLFEAHQFIFVLFLLAFLFRPRIRYILILLFIPVLLMHMSGYGCPFTRIERYYHGQNVTIIDPFLNMFGIPITRDNRETFQAYFSSLLIATMVLTVLIIPSK